MTATRAERNNNPGNIRKGSNWQGLAAKQPDESFCTFTDAKYGFRALAKILQAYRERGINTVAAVINTWAPSVENNTAAYVSAVAGRMHVDPEAPINLAEYKTLAPLVDAITRHESGRNIWLQSVMDAGLALAGVRA
jgi:phage tail sheath gpL-like